MCNGLVHSLVGVVLDLFSDSYQGNPGRWARDPGGSRKSAILA